MPFLCVRLYILAQMIYTIFNSEAESIDNSLTVPKGTKTLAINPLNWKRDGAIAEKYPAGLDIFEEGIYHLYDYQFFYRNLQKNVQTRMDAYQSNR